MADIALETVAHELAHHWFGDSVSAPHRQDAWLSEEFATFAQMRWRGKPQGVAARDAGPAALRARTQGLEAFTVAEQCPDKSAADPLGALADDCGDIPALRANHLAMLESAAG